MSYYKIKQGRLQQNVSKYYRFEPADTLCEQFNKYIKMPKKERKKKRKQKKNIHDEIQAIKGNICQIEKY